jgi:hypothetical protein
MSTSTAIRVTEHLTPDAVPTPIDATPEILAAIKTLGETSPRAAMLVIDHQVSQGLAELRARNPEIATQVQCTHANVFATVRAVRDAAAHDLVAVFPNLEAKYVEVIEDVLPELLRALARAQRDALLERFEQRLKGLELLYPEVDPIRDPRLERVAAALDLQQAFMRTEAVLTSADIAQRAGFSDLNPSHTASRWRKQHKIFGVRYRGKEFYPAFQFDATGQPYPLLKTLLDVLHTDPEITDWDIAVWFTTANGFLSGEVPKTLLNDRRTETQRRLVIAAEQEAVTDDGG